MVFDTIDRTVRSHTIQSNASLNRFPGNTPNNFRVRFAEPIELMGGKWMVALAELHFPTQFKPHIDPTKLTTNRPNNVEKSASSTPNNVGESDSGTKRKRSVSDNNLSNSKRKKSYPVTAVSRVPYKRKKYNITELERKLFVETYLRLMVNE